MRRFLALVLAMLMLSALMAPVALARPGHPPSNPWERQKSLTDQQQVDAWAANLARGWKAVATNSMNKVVAAKYLKGTLPALCGVAQANAGVSTYYAQTYALLQQTVSNYGFPVVC